ncbi:hypothetical protein DENIS_3460 [Desulfonema ishimotonii]|uniref:Uncharacterized protein n=1 Tax=Desulfonema ishimotonii TaxID=45657 RepID=A0A401FZV0_9BACT|nr:hypothetical protein [Desulfonema ishimotonii]GBC62488.1 hypothetical protein DENIS_3460 [Desulfonema ishimotonii]
MTKYRLKPAAPAFTATDGPLAGRSYDHGREYAEIPAAEADWFDPIEPDEVEKKPAPVNEPAAKTVPDLVPDLDDDEDPITPIGIKSHYPASRGKKKGKDKK